MHHNLAQYCQLILIFLFGLMACTHPIDKENASNQSDVSVQQFKSLSIDLQANQLLSIINPKTYKSEEAKAALETYYTKAIPLAKQYGYKNHGTLRVTETIVGTDDPGVFVLASWPNDLADQTFEALPFWQKYKALRPTIWERLRFYKAPSSDAKKLVFREDKFYTIEFVWINPEHSADYYTYSRGIESELKKAGGRTLHNMMKPRFVSHTDAYEGPSEINIVEWDVPQAQAALQKTAAFKKYHAYLQSGTTRYEQYQIKPVIK